MFLIMVVLILIGSIVLIICGNSKQLKVIGFTLLGTILLFITFIGSLLTIYETNEPLNDLEEEYIQAHIIPNME